MDNEKNSKLNLVVDTNIIISSLINPKGYEFELIYFNEIQLYVPKMIFFELFKHKDKIIKYSKLREEDILELFYELIKKIEVVDEKQVPDIYFKKAYEILKDIDLNDIPFIALALFLGLKIWSGDKKLKLGLKNKGYDIVLSSSDLVKVFNEAK